MSEKGHFQRFLRFAIPGLVEKHPFLSRLKESLGSDLPKVSSLNLGESPASGKNLVINFQHNSKPWAAGQFTINVNVSDGLVVAEDFSPELGSLYQFQSGYYRLGPDSGGKDRWWCLKEIIPDIELYEELTSEEDEDLLLEENEILEMSNYVCTEVDDNYVEYWHPNSYSDESACFEEAVSDVSEYLRDKLFVPFGYEHR